MQRRIVLSALTAMVAACGGGGSDGGGGAAAPADPPAAEAPAPCTPKHVRIQLFGDSTMYGYDGSSSTGARAAVYPELALQKAMDEKFGAGAVAVTTRAVNGTLTRNLLEGSDGVNKPWPGSVDADIVVLNYGINDRYTDMPAETYKANLRKLAVAPAKVVFQTPLPVWNVKYSTYLDLSFAPEMKAVAAELNVPVADASAFALSIPNWNSSAYAQDSAHPNSAGYQAIVSNVLAPTLMPMVEAIRCP